MFFRLSSFLLLITLLAGCASFDLYPAKQPNRSPAEKAALYDRFVVHQEPDGTYRAQGQHFATPWQVIRYQAEVEPAWQKSGQANSFAWRDLVWLGAGIAAFNWQVQSHPATGMLSADYGLSSLALQGVLLGFITDLWGRQDAALDGRVLAWNKALAQDLDQPEPVWSAPVSRYDDTLPGLKVGLGFSSTRRSGADYQDYFTPSLGHLTFQYSDPWTEGAFLQVGYGLSPAWSLELEAEAVGERSNGVVWGSNGHVQRMKQEISQGILRLGRAWDWRWPGHLDLSCMPLVGLGVGWMRGEASESDAAGLMLGSSVVRSTAPAALLGLRTALSPAPHWAYTLEFGYRWLRFDYSVLSEAQGSYSDRRSPDLTLHGTQATWDHSGPYLKVGLLFL